eukprot:c15912_g1_i1 orf=108-536(+)
MRANPYTYQGMTRLKTGLELLNASLDLEERVEEVTLPFLVVHGEADVVTDAAVSQGLHESASSLDKTLILYPGMWHSLLFGEPDNNIDHVICDITSWLNKQCCHNHNVGYPSFHQYLTHSDLSSLIDHQHPHKEKFPSHLTI